MNNIKLVAILFLILFEGNAALMPMPIQIEEEPLSPYKFNEKVGQRLIYGDILLSPKQLKMRRRHFGRNRENAKQMEQRNRPPLVLKHIAIKETHNNRWPHNEIPFLFSTKFSERQKQAIQEALSVLEANSCFRFMPRRLQRDFLYFDMREGCFSFVGKIGGRQLLSLASGCLHDYIIWHEVMHALGLEHEHQRPDRDEFIQIKWENVEPGKEINFDKIKWSDVDLYHTYDYHSLMHYDGTAFGRMNPRNRKPMVTMKPLQKGIFLHDNFELTKMDVEKLQILSNCDSTRLKLRPSLEFASSNCKDKSINCQSLAERGFCAEIRYMRLIRIQCQQTCGFCENGKEEKKKIQQIQIDETQIGNENEEMGEGREEKADKIVESEKWEHGVDEHYTRWSYPKKKEEMRINEEKFDNYGSWGQ